MHLVPRSASYTGLLGLLAVAMIVPRIVPIGPGATFVIELGIVVAMVAVVQRLRVRGGLVIVIGAAAVVAELTAGMKFFNDLPLWVVLNHVSRILFVLLVLGCILFNVWGQKAVETDTIIGGVVVYLLLGIAFAGVYQLIEFIQPGSFAVSNPEAGHWGPWEPEAGIYPRLFFFSFVTLTTLGYGDITPASQPTAALTSLEAVVGSLYLTILIARLVGLHIAGKQK